MVTARRVRNPRQFRTRFDERAIALLAAFAFGLRVVLLGDVEGHAEYALDFRAAAAVRFAARAQPQTAPVLEFDREIEFERHTFVQAPRQLAREPRAVAFGDSVEEPLQRHFRLLLLEPVDVRELGADARRAAAHVPFP